VFCFPPVLDLSLGIVPARAKKTRRPKSGHKSPAPPGPFFHPLCIGGHPPGNKKTPATGRPWRGFGARHAEELSLFPPSEPRQSADERARNFNSAAKKCTFVIAIT